ncbi:hypothetical protein MARPU_08780 [Marichromatium purpuratum 984]|uniref:Uncharacterized protein n=1 Tax=Marichromatium purpuratum 984 TaxID=765910 RepID=W0E7I6_MARPU|nr:hypothetical protein MARPU_08780 [Marichromatium purpuratum 984]
MKKVLEIFLNFATGEARHIGHCGQQDRVFRITQADPSGITAFECAVPTLEQFFGQAQRCRRADNRLDHLRGVDRFGIE